MTEKRKRQLQEWKDRRERAYKLNQEGKSYGDLAREWDQTPASIYSLIRKYKRENNL